MNNKSKANKSIIISIFPPFFTWLTRLISPHNLLPQLYGLILGKRTPTAITPLYTETYVFAWLVLIIIMLTFATDSGWLFWPFIILAILRIVDIFTEYIRVVMSELLDNSDDDGYFLYIRNPMRWLALTLINIVQAILMFAVLYRLIAFNIADSFMKFNPILKIQENAIPDSLTAIYFSFLTFTTLGHEGITANHWAGQVCVIAELLCFIVTILVILPIAISALRVKQK